MSKGVHVAHNKLEANLQDQHGQSGHGAIPLSAGMLLVTLGVVYGDIGTSPMYTMKSIVANNGGIGTVSEDMILGALSLVIWTMTLVTTVKYVLIAMRADNHNEGGIFALFSLVRKVAPWLILPAMIGGAALLADGILTPPSRSPQPSRVCAPSSGATRYWATARPTSSLLPSSLSAAYLPCSAPAPRQSASSSARS